MKKVYLSTALLALLGIGSSHAQDIYKVEQLSSQDLDGDARFVGMGGAMGALGANISAMGVNPASTAMYRRSDIALTAGFVQTPYNGTVQVGPSRSRGTFDQAGFVYAINLGNVTGVKFVNMGFNYRKSRNLKSYFGLNDIRTQDGLSQSWQFRDLAADLNGNWIDLGNETDSENTTPSTLLAYDTYYIDAVDENGESVGSRPDAKIADYVPSYANRYNYHRAQWGGVGDYDFNLALNINERVYLGTTLTMHDVNIHNAVLYEEELYQNNNVHDTGFYQFYTDESMTGFGIDAKFGMLVRPIEESPFRFGVAITTPTAFDLETRSYAYMTTPYADDKGNPGSEQDVKSNNSFRIRTPWKVDVSAATTIDNYLAIDAEYQLQCASSAAVRYEDGGDGYYTSNGISYNTDVAIQDEIGKYYNNVHTFRLGIEGRLSREFSARIGYNYVSAPLNKKAFLNQYLDGSSYYYALNTDYVNPGPVNRVTLGLGYRHKSFYLDAAYQHQLQDATAYAFHYGKDGRTDETNALHGQDIGLHRNQFIVTMGFKF